MESNIIITNNSQQTALISIEGIIGVSQAQQGEYGSGAVSTYEDFKQQLESISQIENPQIIVDIRSTGGSVNDALLIHDAIVSTGAEVITRCYGYVASAATIIAQAASEGMRQISANALYLIHNSVSEAEGNAQKMVQTAELLDKTDQTIAAIYAARSGRGVDEFVALMAENDGSGRWLTPQEAKEFALVDSIIEKATVVESVVNYSREKIAALWGKLVNALGVGHELEESLGQESENGATMADRSKDEQVAEMDGADDGHQAEAEIEVISRAEYDRLQQEGASGEEIQPQELVAEGSGEQQQVDVKDVEGSTLKVVNEAMGVAKFETAEALQARAAAAPSLTMEVEDPAIDDAKPVGNSRAYYEDVKNF